MLIQLVTKALSRVIVQTRSRTATRMCRHSMATAFLPTPSQLRRIGSAPNVDDSEVANADETGRTTDAPRDEVRPLK